MNEKELKKALKAEKKKKKRLIREHKNVVFNKTETNKKIRELKKALKALETKPIKVVEPKVAPNPNPEPMHQSEETTEVKI